MNGSPVGLTPQEFDLLTMFLERRGRLLTRDFLIAELWGARLLRRLQDA